MADVTFEIDTYDWTQAITRFSVGMGKGFREALYEEWPLLMRKIMDFTPPFKVGSNSSDLSVGRAAVTRDVRKTMRPFNPAARTKQLGDILDRGDIRAFNAFAGNVKSGPMRGALALPFSPGLHTRQRNNRGRVTSARQYTIIGPEVGMFKKYLKDQNDNVGIAKAGWFPAMLLVGGDAPNFVSRHGTRFGSYIDDHANEDDPSITAINRTPWASRRDEGQRIIKAAYASRTEAIMKKLKVKLRLAAKDAGLDVVAA